MSAGSLGWVEDDLAFAPTQNSIAAGADGPA